MSKFNKIISYEITKLGKYLKQLRKEQVLSIRQVAQQCKIAPSYLSKIEAGNTCKTIGVETLVKFSKFYGIPVSSMLKEAGFIDSYENDLPELPQYLRAKYQLSPQAIRDMEMAKEIVDKKYGGDARSSRWPKKNALKEARSACRLRAVPGAKMQDVEVVMTRFCWIGMFRIMAPREAWSRR